MRLRTMLFLAGCLLAALAAVWWMSDRAQRQDRYTVVIGGQPVRGLLLDRWTGDTWAFWGGTREWTRLARPEEVGRP